MDPARFDTLARTLSGLAGHLPTRRTLVRALGAGLLGLGIGSGLDAEAKKGRKRRRKKKKKVCLFGQRRCRDRRCHGCCADADCGGNVCDSGTCSDCPRNQRLCRGGCISEDACCVDDECTGDRVCVDGTCACGPDRRLCEGVCIAADACCGTDCPVETCTPENCNGCCDGNTCRNGDSGNFCGRNGAGCDQCVSGETCDAGVCRGGGACSAENCNGCCDGNTCREGDSQNNCGRGGVTCTTCGARAVCDAGACICPDGLVSCPDGSCLRCDPRETCVGGACVCPTECCADADCTERDGGLCRPNGICVYRPNCIGADQFYDCNVPELRNCCSFRFGLCPVGGSGPCPKGSRDTSCRTDADCDSGVCSYYVCV